MGANPHANGGMRSRICGCRISASTRHVWRQDHNGFTHQDPGFVDLVVNKKAEAVRAWKAVIKDSKTGYTLRDVWFDGSFPGQDHCVIPGPGAALLFGGGEILLPRER